MTTDQRSTSAVQVVEEAQKVRPECEVLTCVGGSTNEELQSAIKELQSANEELQTTQKELQSLNQELETINAELRRKVDELLSNAQLVRVSERLLRDVIDGSPDLAIFLKDRDGRFLAANRYLERLLGITREDLQGKTDYDVFPREQAEYLREHDRLVLEGGRSIIVEEGVDLVDGHHTYLASKFPLRDPSGRIYGVGAISHDITARKRIEEELKRSEATLEAFFEASPGILHIMDEDFRYIKTDSMTPTYYGLTRQTIIGRSANELAPEFIASVGPMMREVLETGVPRLDQEIPGPLVREAGKDTTWRASCFPVPLGAGRRGIGMMGIEITDIKKAQAERERILETLQETDRRRNEFLAMLSHELRNPLAPIRNSLYVLDRAAPGGEQARRALAVIDRQVEHMARLIDDLLDVTRVARGKMQLQPERLDLNQLTQRTVEDHRSVFVKNRIAIEVMPAPGELWVSGDRTRLAQAIGNLLQNAAKFTPAGGTTTVSVQVDSSRAQAVVQVRDTGAGISPDILPRLFEAFTQGDATLNRSKGGLGLGLALVKGLVEMHGGSVTGSSEGAGKGAAFTIRLPLDNTLAATVPIKRSADHICPRRVLVIEDNIDAAESLREALELGEHLVEVAYDGKQGIGMARAFKPEVVLCDIGLPEMDGYEVARSIRADPELGRIALVALTGYAQPGDIARAKLAGFDAHLAKPPTIEALERTLAGLDANVDRSVF